MSDVDTMRWGDTQALKILAAASEGGAVQSGQILNAHWQRPCVWRLLFSAKAEVETGSTLTSFDVVVSLRIGVGQANQLITLATLSFATPFTASSFNTQFFDVPAENLQLVFFVQNVAGIPLANDQVVLTAFTAPRAEPGGIVQIRDGMPGNDGIREPDRDGLARWPGRGFEDGELRYRGRGY